MRTRQGAGPPEKVWCACRAGRTSRFDMLPLCEARGGKKNSWLLLGEFCGEKEERTKKKNKERLRRPSVFTHTARRQRGKSIAAAEHWRC